MVITIPLPAIQPMMGIYLKISRFTPVREVKVVEPVKFNVMKAVIAGMIKSLGKARNKLENQI